MNTFIKDGIFVNMEEKIFERKDIRIENGIVTEIGNLEKRDNEQLIDAKSLYILPGLFDMHVHFREPGYEYKETINTGSLAAAKGGYTGVLTMPNTKPVIDNVDILQKLNDIITKDSIVDIFPAVAVTIDQKGECLSKFESLKKAGAYALSDDGQPVMDEKVMEKALALSKQINLPVLIHSEDKRFVNNGCINEGIVSKKLDVRGISPKAEYEMINRDVKLAEKLNTPIHMCHVSTKESVQIIRDAKKKGIKVTCEVAPHHFYADESMVLSKKSIAKVNPPLRTNEDVQEIIKGLQDGTIDAIATDHAPHSKEEKAKNLYDAPFGISGIELALPLTITKLMNNKIDIYQIIELMCINPRKILGLDDGLIKVGREASITLVDMEKTQLITEESLVSKGKNTPFIGETLQGIVEYTILREKVIYRR